MAAKVAIVSGGVYHVRAHQVGGAGYYMAMSNDTNPTIQLALQNLGYGTQQEIQTRILNLVESYPALFKEIEVEKSYVI